MVGQYGAKSSKLYTTITKRIMKKLKAVSKLDLSNSPNEISMK